MTSSVHRAALDIVAALRGNTPSLDDIVTARIHGELSDASQDPEMADLLRASVEGNTTLLHHMMMNDLDSSTLRLAAASTEYAHRLARRGVGANTLLAAYQVGHLAADEALRAELDQRNHPDALARSVSELLSRTTLTCVSWITKAAMEAYDAERVRLAKTGSSDVITAVRAIVAGGGPSSAEFTRRTGHTLEGRHLGLQIWITDTGPGETTVADVARSILRTRPNTTALVVPVDTVTAHVWLSVQDPEPDVASLEPAAHAAGVRIAVGSILPGRAGFIRTIEQAQAAASVAVCRQDGPIIQWWSEPGVPLVAILLKDFEATRLWVRETLRGLAAPTREAGTLRETLWVFLSSNRSWTLSAQRLHLHRNSVRYRVDRAAALMGVQDHADIPQEASTALQTARVLGDVVLAAPNPITPTTNDVQ